MWGIWIGRDHLPGGSVESPIHRPERRIRVKTIYWGGNPCSGGGGMVK